jgi:ubiquinone/menaquinone biosynthesis C-methylase UbiE
MNSAQDSIPDWGASYKLTAAEKWKAKNAEMGRAATEALVGYARPRTGMNVLDLASGTGEPSISLAMHVGPKGHVTALDLSPELLKVAEQRAQARGLTNFSTQQADAQELPFPDQSFDLVTSRFGVMFFAQPEKALREVHRVLRPKARACFLAWGPFEQPFWSTTMGVVAQRLGGLTLPPGQDPFRFAQPGSLASVLHQSGLQEVEEQSRTLPWTWPGKPEEVWELMQAVATPFLPLLGRIREENRSEIDAEVLSAMGRYADGDSVKFGAVVVFASGTR